MLSTTRKRSEMEWSLEDWGCWYEREDWERKFGLRADSAVVSFFYEYCVRSLSLEPQHWSSCSQFYNNSWQCFGLLYTDCSYTKCFFFFFFKLVFPPDFHNSLKCFRFRVQIFHVCNIQDSVWMRLWLSPRMMASLLLYIHCNAWWMALHSHWFFFICLIEL